MNCYAVGRDRHSRTIAPTHIQNNTEKNNMHIVKYDIFDAIGKVDIACITTNGFINKRGECVMGKGCAKQASDRYPGMAQRLADKIRSGGNIPYQIGASGGTLIYSFPVKPISGIFDGGNSVSYMRNNYSVGDTVPGWACKADLKLIRNSALHLAEIVNESNVKKIAIPMPGCGAGELGWDDVSDVVSDIFDDRFYILYK